LEKENVNTQFLTVDGGETNYSTVITYQGERTIFVYHGKRDYIFPDNLPEAKWVYITSMGETFAPFYKKIIDWAGKNPNTKISFNPGSWQFKKWDESVEGILKRTTLLFVNREEAEKITGLKKGEYEEKILLDKLHERGVVTPVITDGTGGAMCFTEGRYYKIGVMPIDAYERTGAGDAFGAGFLSAVIKGKSIEEALLWGTVNSSSVIGYTGPQKGLLYESQIEEWIARCKSAEVIPVQF
jgi:sugar/nucleoside kinase (ribokinase family)